MVEMKIKGVAVDSTSNMPIIVLKEKEGSRTLPILVGLFEANAIAMELEGFASQRPLTHDLIKSIIDGLQGKVTLVCIHALRGNTFFSRISISRGKKRVDIDARPCDALAVALRSGASIYVAEEVLKNVSSLNVVLPEKGDIEKLRSFLAGLRPEDFGHYKM